MEENKFWLIVWSILSTALVLIVLPISSCIQTVELQQNETTREALKRGCSTFPGPNSTVAFRCP